MTDPRRFGECGGDRQGLVLAARGAQAEDGGVREVVVVVYERWRSLADLETHLRTSHATILRDAFNDLIVGVPEFTILTPVPFMIADGETRGALA